MKKNYGVGIDFKRQTYNGTAVNTVSEGALGIFAVERSFDDNGNLVGWFWGIDAAAKGAVIAGIDVGFRLGFSN